PRLGGHTGPGRDEDAVVGAHRGDVDDVVAHDLGPGTELGEVPDDRVDERVVVVDHEDPGHHSPTVSWLKGMCGAIAGKTQPNRATTTAPASTSAMIVRTHTGPGRRRHNHPYIMRLLRSRPGRRPRSTPSSRAPRARCTARPRRTSGGTRSS